MSSDPAGVSATPGWRVPIVLFVLTLASTTFIGSYGEGWTAGLAYSLPLMAILLSHEFGHYIAARMHRVPASPPFFIPVPLAPLGTMGAIILMPDRITRRNALLDIGAAGPLAGLLVALPILAYGIMESPVEPIAVDSARWQEGHSLVYAGMLYLLKGPIPDGHDIMLSRTAFAGWAGLLVTMLNLVPCVQLDGGHVAHALLGERHERVSRTVRKLLLPVALLAGLYYGWPAFADGVRGERLMQAAAPGVQWLILWALLWWMAGASPGPEPGGQADDADAPAARSRREHPPTDDHHLSPGRRAIAWFTLALFPLLFMPGWIRAITPP